MVETTKAIVFSSIKYAEADLIVTCFTESSGLKTYLLRGILKSRKGRLKPSYFHALILDKDCGCAKLTLAYISSGNQKWGSRMAKLDAIETQSLTPEERGWYDIMSANKEEKAALENTLASKYPESALLNFLSTSMQDFNTF